MATTDRKITLVVRTKPRRTDIISRKSSKKKSQTAATVREIRKERTMRIVQGECNTDV